MSIRAINEHIIGSVEPLIIKLGSPLNLGRVATKLPQRLKFSVIEKILNHVFSEQIEEGDFDFLELRTFQMEVTDAKLFIVLSFKNQRLICNHCNNFSTTAEVYLSIDALNAIRLIQQEIDPDTLFFQRKLEISGDTELAHQVKNTIDTFNPELIPDFMMKILSDYRKRVFREH